MKKIPMVFFYRQLEMKSEERQKLLDDVFEIIFNLIFTKNTTEKVVEGGENK